MNINIHTDDIKLNRSEQFLVLKRLLAYMKPLKTGLIISIIILVISSLTDLLRPVIIKTIIDDYILSGNKEMKMILVFSALYLAISFITYLMKYVYVYSFNAMGNKVTKNIRQEIFQKLQGMGMRYFDQTPAGSIVSRVTNDTEAIQEMLVAVLGASFSSAFMMLAVLIAMFSFNTKLALISLLFIPMTFVAIYNYRRLSTKSFQKARSKLSILNTKLAETISGMSIIQIFNQQKRLIEDFDETNQEYYQARMANLKLNSLLLSPITSLLTSLTIAAILSYFGISFFFSAISAGMLLLFVDYIYMLYDPILIIIDRLAIYQQAIVSASRVFTILDHSEISPIQKEKNLSINKGKIEFKNVTFAYDDRNNVLENISFTVNPGETIALVGHTGSGKSSIINLIMRFYEFDQGEILIDGHSIKNYPIAELRKNMSLVLQDPFIYYGSVADNIRLLNDKITDEEVIAAAEFVQADTFITSLAGSYQHQVTERGSSFSSGQKQLLAFARTIVTDPKILILDEATANIDTETEALIQDSLQKIAKGRTTIAIAHRLSTIKDANQILVLEDGKIIESGKHDELLNLKGVYNQMYQLQKLEN